MADLTTLYAQAPALVEAGERVLSTDEMTGIQALERKHPTRLMEPGQAERREFEYIRRGTLTLIANFDIAQGMVVAPSLGPTRTEEDFVTHITHTVASDPRVRAMDLTPPCLRPAPPPPTDWLSGPGLRRGMVSYT